ncbi:MAG TPA: serine hydrolase [Vicinamibacterales bacterium]|nr:serine hydrolase [Vicinamibacterales bacterium]
MKLMRTPLLALVALSASVAAQQSPASYPMPTGSPTSNGLAGFAKILCSAVFVSGRQPEEAAKNSAYFFMPRGEDADVTWKIDRTAGVVTTTRGEVSRTAKLHGDQGCIIENLEKPGIHFKPVPVRTTLPDAATMAWPMGDKPDPSPLPAGVDRATLDAALNAAFSDPAALTQAFLVVHKGRIVAERYAPGVTKDTQLENWSMGKSLTATLFALLVKDGVYTIDQPAPVPAWRQPGDPRGPIRNRDLLQMSAGLKFVGNQEPGGGTPQNTVFDHYYIYTGAVDAFEYSITRPVEFPAGTDGRYRNSDPLTIGYLIKRAVQAKGEEYLTFPQRRLFDRIGIRRQVLETDPWGNFLMTGYDYGTARNWARIGMLYLQDGVWNGQRLLPEGWTKFVSTPAPAWRRAEYGAFFWLNGVGNWTLPPETYLAAGAGGQNTWIVPGHDLVIVRLGHMRGQNAARRGTNEALGLVMRAIGSTTPMTQTTPTTPSSEEFGVRPR